MTHGISGYVPPDKVQVQVSVTMRNLLRDPSRWSPAQFRLVTASRPATAAVAKGPQRRSPRAPGRAGCSLTPRWTRASPSSCRATARSSTSSSARTRRRSRWSSTSGARAGARRRRRSCPPACSPTTEAHDDRAHHRPRRRTASRAARPPVAGVPAHACLRLRDRHVDAGHARRGGRLRALRAAAAPALAARLDAVAAARVHVRVARTRRDAPPRGAPRAGAVRPRARGADLRRGLRARRQLGHRDRRAAARRALLRAPRRPRAGVRGAHGAGRPRRPRRQPPHLPARHERPRAPHPVGGPRAPHVAPAGVALRPRRSCGPRSASSSPPLSRSSRHKRAARDRRADARRGRAPTTRP